VAKIAIVCPPATGHVHPSIALGTALREHGHQVVFFQVAPIGRNAGFIDEAGFLCRIYGPERLQRYLHSAYSELSVRSGKQALKLMIEIVRSRTAETMHLFPTLFDEEGIDFVLIDQLLPCAATAAQVQGTPFATISNALVLNADPVVPPCFTSWTPSSNCNRFRIRLAHTVYSWHTRPIRNVINAYRSQNGCPKITSLDDTISDRLQLSQQPEFFEFSQTKSPPSLHYCGPFLRPQSRQTYFFPWDRLSGRPLIYLSMGTLQNRLRHVFRIVAEACAGLDVDLAMTTGGSEITEFDFLPGDPIVVQFAPQLELLQRATVCVTHAGLNTALESLAAGVPLLAIPIANDQPGVAARIEYMGFGRRLSQRTLTVKSVRLALIELMNSDAPRNAVKTARERLQQIDGCSRGAELIENAIEGLNCRPKCAHSTADREGR